MTIRNCVLAAAALSLSLGLRAVAEDLSPSTILASPATYEGKAVTVEGQVANFQKTKTLMGSVTAFQLCDSECVLVIDETNASHYANGDHASASGMFQTKFKGPKRSFANVILIKK